MLVRASPRTGALRALDFGAGRGVLAQRFRALTGITAHCVEPDAQARAVLRERGFNAYESVDALKAQSIDFVWTVNVLEHIDDDAGTLVRLRALCARGARLFVWVPAFDHLWTAHDDAVGHKRRYTRVGLAETVAHAGFAVRSVRYADALGYVAALGFKALKRKDARAPARALARYDRWVWPLSERLDRLGASAVLGKNLVCIAEVR